MRRSGYDAGHLPQAVYLPPEAICDANSAPTFLPSPAVFKAMMQKLGISDSTRVTSTTRANYFGHSNVALVNGGWRKWTSEQRPTPPAVPAIAGAAQFTPRPQPRWLATASDVVAAINKPAVKIVDARTDREIGGAPQPNIKSRGILPWHEVIVQEVVCVVQDDSLLRRDEPRAEKRVLRRLLAITASIQLIPTSRL